MEVRIEPATILLRSPRATLQFYSVCSVTGVRKIFPMLAIRICALASIVAIAGCATATDHRSAVKPPVPTTPAPYVEPPPPPVNLQGFPPSYRLGFGDGCATGRGTEKKDPVRFGQDGNYRVGWQDGLAQCKKK